MNNTTLMGRLEVEDALSSVRNLRLMPVNGISLSFDASGMLYVDIDGDKYNLNNDARKGVLKQVGISEKCVSKIANADERLASDVLTTLYENIVGEGIFVMRDETPVDFGLVGAFNYLPVENVLDAIEQAVGSNLRFSRAIVGRGSEVQLEIVGEREGSPVVGDVVQSGLMVRFNPLCITNPYIAPYGLRLICSNGMVSREAYGTAIEVRGFLDDPTQWISDRCKEAYESFDELVRDWRRMNEYTIDVHERNRVLALTLSNAGIRGMNAKMVMHQAIANPPESMYDILNLLTWASTHILTNPNGVMRAQSATAAFMSDTLSAELCPACLR